MAGTGGLPFSPTLLYALFDASLSEITFHWDRPLLNATFTNGGASWYEGENLWTFNDTNSPMNDFSDMIINSSNSDIYSVVDSSFFKLWTVQQGMVYEGASPEAGIYNDGYTDFPTFNIVNSTFQTKIQNDQNTALNTSIFSMYDTGVGGTEGVSNWDFQTLYDGGNGYIVVNLNENESSNYLGIILTKDPSLDFTDVNNDPIKATNLAGLEISIFVSGDPTDGLYIDKVYFVDNTGNVENLGNIVSDNLYSGTDLLNGLNINPATLLENGSPIVIGSINSYDFDNLIARADMDEILNQLNRDKMTLLINFKCLYNKTSTVLIPSFGVSVRMKFTDILTASQRPGIGITNSYSARIGSNNVATVLDNDDRLYLSVAIDNTTTIADRFINIGGNPVTLYDLGNGLYSIGVFRSSSSDMNNYDINHPTDLTFEGRRFRSYLQIGSSYESGNGSSGGFYSLSGTMDLGSSVASKRTTLFGINLGLNENNALIFHTVTGTVTAVRYSMIGGIPLKIVEVNGRWYLNLIIE